MNEEKTLQWCRLCIVSGKAVETDILVKRTPMNASEPETIIGTLLIRSILQSRVPE